MDTKSYSIESIDQILSMVDKAFDPVECMKMQIYPLPHYMLDGVVKYLMHGIIPGSFLQSVICNSLKDSAATADQTNRERLWEWANFLYNHMPAAAHGSAEKMAEWARRGGLMGKEGEE